MGVGYALNIKPTWQSKLYYVLKKKPFFIVQYEEYT